MRKKYKYTTTPLLHGTTLLVIGEEWEFVCITRHPDGNEVHVFRKEVKGDE